MTPIWTDVKEQMPPPLKTVIVATLCEHTNDGWTNLGHLDNDGAWWLDDAVDGDSIVLTAGFRIIAWQLAPEWPQHIYKTAEAIAAEAIVELDDYDD